MGAAAEVATLAETIAAADAAIAETVAVFVAVLGSGVKLPPLLILLGPYKHC